MINERLMFLLLEANTNQNNEARAQAERELSQNTSTSAILDIVCSNCQVSEYAAIYLNTLIKKKQFNENEYNAQVQLNDLTRIISCLEQPVQFRKHLIQVITTLIGEDGTTYNGNKQDILRNFVQQQMIECFAKQSNEVAILLWNSLVNSLDMYKLGSMMQKSEQDWVQCYISRGIKILLSIADLLRGVHSIEFLNNLELMEILRIMKSWSQGISNLLTKVAKFKGFPKEHLVGFQNFLIHNSEFSFGLYSYLGVTLNINNQITDAMISCTQTPALDDLINEGKYYVLQSYNHILGIIFNERQKQDCKKTPFYAMLTQLLPNVIHSIVQYATSKSHDFLQQMRNNHIAPLVTQMLQIIVQSGSQPDFYLLLSDSKIDIIVDIIYPLLCTTKEEYVQMIDEPEEFVNLALDTVDKQKSSDIPKTAAAALLEVFCDHIDGSTTLIAEMSIMIINAEVETILLASTIEHGILLHSNVRNSVFFQKLQERYFFYAVTALQRIDACLVALTVMSYLLSRRPDVLIMMEGMLKCNNLFFKDENLDGLIRARLALFFGYYCDNLFKQDKTNLVKYIDILVVQLFPQKHAWHLAVKYQSIDALKNIFEDEELVPTLKALIQRTLLMFAQSMHGTTYQPYFDLMSSIFKLYSAEIKLDPKLFSQALQWIVWNVQNYAQDTKQNQLYIDKSLQVIRSIPDSECYGVEFLDILEAQLLPLYEMMEHSQTTFEEEILQLICSLIERTGHVSLNQQKMFMLFPQIVQRKQVLDGVFQALNLYIQKGTDMFRNVDVQRMVSMLCSMAFHVINHNSIDATESEQGEGVLILHLAIQTLGQSLQDQTLTDIFQGVFQKAQTLIRSNFLKSRLMGVFLSAFYVDSQRTEAILLSLGIMDKVLQQMMNVCYPGGYDIKLFVVTMAKLLEVSPMFFNASVINNLVVVLTRQQKSEEREQLRIDLDSSEYVIEDIIIDENENEDEEEVHHILQLEQEESKQAFQYFKSEILCLDEFERFRSIMMQYKQKQPELIQQLKNGLTGAELQLIQNMMSCVRVQSQEGTMIPRKVPNR